MKLLRRILHFYVIPLLSLQSYLPMTVFRYSAVSFIQSELVFFFFMCLYFNSQFGQMFSSFTICLYYVTCLLAILPIIIKNSILRIISSLDAYFRKILGR